MTCLIRQFGKSLLLERKKYPLNEIGFFSRVR